MGIDLDSDMIGSVPREDSEVLTDGLNEYGSVEDEERAINGRKSVGDEVEKRVVDNNDDVDEGFSNSVEEEVEGMESDEGNNDNEDEALDLFEIVQEKITEVDGNTLEDNTYEEEEKEVNENENENGEDTLLTEKLDGLYSKEEVNDDKTVEKKADKENERAASKKSNKPPVSQRNKKCRNALSQMNGQESDSHPRRSRRRHN